MGQLLSTGAKIHTVSIPTAAPGPTGTEGDELWRVLRPLIEKKSWDKVHAIILEQQLAIIALTEDHPTGNHLTPLQVALLHHFPVFIVKSLLELCPAAATMKDFQSEMRTPLHDLMVSSKTAPSYLDGALLRTFIDANPSCLLVGDVNVRRDLSTIFICYLISFYNSYHAMPWSRAPYRCTPLLSAALAPH